MIPNSIEVEDNGYVIHLRKNFAQSEDGTWTYDEVTFKHAGASLEWLGKNFEKLYNKYAEIQKTDADRIKDLQGQCETYRQALMELTELIGDLKEEAK